MTEVSLRSFVDTIAFGVREKNCVQAWIGQFGVLFLGFGHEVMPPPSPGDLGFEEYPIPPYELVTSYSSWCLYSSQGLEIDSNEVTSVKSREVAQERLQLIVGKAVQSWSTQLPSWRLTLRLGEEFELVVIPYNDAVEEDRDVWDLRCPDGFYVSATARHEVYRHSGSDKPRPQRRTSGTT